MLKDYLNKMQNSNIQQGMDLIRSRISQKIYSEMTGQIKNGVHPEVEKENYFKSRYQAKK